MKFKGEQNFQHENEQKKGVLIAYLGTPDSPDGRHLYAGFLSRLD